MREYVRFSKNRKLHGAIGILFDIASYALCTLFCIILVCIYVLHFAAVQGDSMLPTLQSGNRLLVNALDRDPECGDVVIITALEAGLLREDGSPYPAVGLDKVIVKRVIAVAGQEIDIDSETGTVYRDGMALEEAYAVGSTTEPILDGAFVYPITVPEGYVYVLGDNREVSMDSRYAEVGLVPLYQIEGKVILRLNDKFGKIE